MAAWASLVALPAAALGLLAYRLLLDATVLGGAVALAALGGIVLGVRILLDLRRIKLGG
jgi:ABC-type tungstate transport system substrate-binding protein